MASPKQLIIKLIIIVALGLSVGCAGTIGKLPLLTHIHDRFDNLVPPIESPVIDKIKHFDADRFNTCMLPLTANLKPGFTKLIHTLKTRGAAVNNHVLGKIHQIGDEDILQCDVELHPVIDHLFSKLLDDIPIDGQIPAASGKLADFNQAVLEKFKSNQETFVQDTKSATERLKDYLIAYFTKGALQTVSQSLQNQELKDQLAEVLKRKADAPAINKALGLIDNQLLKASTKKASHSTGFIARDGTQFSFPGIQYDHNQVNIDHSQIGADIIRILLEALRDTYAPLPVLDTATALNTKTAPKLDAYKLLFNQDNSATIAWHFDHRNPQKSEQITISKDEFEKIEAHARKAEAFVAGNVGKVIRGGSWGALNNEAVAKLIETAAGVIARHITERAQWCMQAQAKLQNNNQ